MISWFLKHEPNCTRLGGLAHFSKITRITYTYSTFWRTWSHDSWRRLQVSQNVEFGMSILLYFLELLSGNRNSGLYCMCIYSARDCVRKGYFPFDSSKHHRFSSDARRFSSVWVTIEIINIVVMQRLVW